MSHQTFATQSDVADIQHSLNQLNHNMGRLVTLVDQQIKFLVDEVEGVVSPKRLYGAGDLIPPSKLTQWRHLLHPLLHHPNQRLSVLGLQPLLIFLGKVLSDMEQWVLFVRVLLSGQDWPNAVIPEGLFIF